MRIDRESQCIQKQIARRISNWVGNSLLLLLLLLLVITLAQSLFPVVGVCR
jgi:hypothetical protein